MADNWRAILHGKEIIGSYRQGLGLFQMTRRAERRQESTPEEPTTT